MPRRTTAHRDPTRRHLLAARLAVALAACMLSGVPSASAQVRAPRIDIQSVADQWLLAGSADDPYWVIDDRWGQGSIPASAFSQGVGAGSTADGRVAFRMQWRWPQGETEVKGFPAAVYGRKPGYASYTASLLRVGGLAAANAAAPRGPLPLRLPVPSLKAHGAFQHNTPPTGQGRLSFDLWLQSDERQGDRWQGASITHEIMVPLEHWGNYGAHPSGRNPRWYDHDATIAGKLCHVYTTKDGDGCSRYTFGSLDETYGRTGWKLIIFIPDELPAAPGDVDLAAIVNHVATRKDACGQLWARCDEYLVSAELGVEPVVGTGDITVYDYRSSSSGVAQTLPDTAVVPARSFGSDAGYPPGSGGTGSSEAPGSGGGSGSRSKRTGRVADTVGAAAPSPAAPVVVAPAVVAPPPVTKAPLVAAAPSPAPAGANLPPPPGATVPPPAGAFLPAPAGATLPPAAGANLPPPGGATALSASGTDDDAATEPSSPAGPRAHRTAQPSAAPAPRPIAPPPSAAESGPPADIAPTTAQETGSAIKNPFGR
jgi:hypothetical protein